jgi:hypothetical protein
MGGSKKWNCDLRELRDLRLPDDSTVDAGQQILDALAKDRYGMAISSMAYRNPNSRALALSGDGGEYVAPTRDTVMARQYPLDRLHGDQAGSRRHSRS